MPRTCLGWREMKEAGNGPSISVIVPVYNDPEGISTTLRSLLAQDGPPEGFEVIVVDNNSTDRTPRVIGRFKERAPRKVRALVERDVQSSYAARNRGVKEARGGILVFLDSDMWVGRDYLTRIWGLMEGDRKRYVGLNVEIVARNGTMAELYDKVTGFPVREYMEEDHFCPTCCLVTYKGLFDEVGPFDQRLISSGDREFGHRVHRHGTRFRYVSTIRAYHPARRSFRSLMRKWVRLGRGVNQLKRHLPRRYANERRAALDLRYYLPPPPKVISRMRENGRGLPLWKRMAFVLIGWLEKIFTQYGYLHEERMRRGR